MIIGAPKCGTTSLFEYLSLHPHIRAPAEKELCIFSKVREAWHVSSWDAYVTAMRGKGKCDDQRTFEACPFYLGEHRAAERITATFPRLRAIALLRNPIDRTLSAFHDRNPLGWLPVPGSQRKRMEPTLRQLLARIGSNSNGSIATRHLHWEDYEARVITNGIYIHGLRHWALHAPLLLVRTEDLLSEPMAQLERVQDFLGVERALAAAQLAKQHNKGGEHSLVREQPSKALR